jgi:hypothetical protein
VLRCTLTRVEDVPYTYGGSGSQNFNVGEYRLTLVVQVEYTDQTKNEKIWTREFRNWGTYNHQTGAPEERDQGFQEAIEKLADDILTQMVSGW